MGASSAAFYSDIDCRSYRDVADIVGLFQTHAVVAWRDFYCPDGLDGEAHADIGCRDSSLFDDPANVSVFFLAIH